MSQGIPKKDTLILPQFITLRDTGGFHMALYPKPNNPNKPWDSLRCIIREPDENCTFTVLVNRNGRTLLQGTNDKFVRGYAGPEGGTCFRCDERWPDDGELFEIIRAKGNQIYLHGINKPGSFMTSNQAANKNGVAGSAYATNDCLFTVSEPIVSKEIISVDYDLPNAVMWDVPPIIALNTTVRNDSRSSAVQQTLGYSYQRSKVGTWNNTAGIEIGVETSFSAIAPFIGSADFTVSFSASYSREWGGSEGTEETVTSSTQITVPSGKKGKATVLVKRKAMDVKFRYKQKIVYKDGKTKITEKDGVYNNVESYAVDVQAGDWEDA